MKTSIKVRIQRLVCLSVAVCGIVIGTAGLSGAYTMASHDGKQLGEYVTECSSVTMAEEVEYISDSLDKAQPSEEGDYTFDRVFMYGTQSGYDLGDAEQEISSVSTGEMFLTQPVVNPDGDRVILAAKGREDGIVVGELGYDYFVAILETLKRVDGDKGYILNSDGELVLANNYEETQPDMSVEKLGLGGIYEKLRAGESGTLTARINEISGSRMLFTYQPIADTGLYVVYGTEAGKIFSIFYILITFMIVVIVVEFFGAAFVGFKCAAKISDSLTGTTERLVKLSDGDVHSEFEPSRRGDETEVLSEAMLMTIQRLSSYIRDISDVLTRLSDGDLTASSSIEYAGDFVGIRSSLDKITADLRSTMTDIRAAGAQVLDGADSMSDGAQTLAANASEEASALNEITSEAEEIQNRIAATAKTAAEASQLLGKMIGSSEECGSTMNDMSGAMEDISRSSEEIKKIVEMIDDIAFQTNILALNASIEAARAGEAGKGFAVVADEVGNLAGKSAQAAQNTMELVARSSAAVQRGSELTEETRKALDEMSSHISSFEDMMKSISQDSDGENRSIHQINAGLSRITNAVQSNTGAAEETAGTAEELRGQADTLNNRLAAFRLN